MNSYLLASEMDRLYMKDTVTGNGAETKIRTPDPSAPATSSRRKHVSSKAALATIMDFSLLSNSTVMLIDVIQGWKVAGTEPIIIILLILLPIVMLIQLPVAVMLILTSHGNFDKLTRSGLHAWILALLAISAGLMLVADLLKVRTDALFSASVFIQKQSERT